MDVQMYTMTRHPTVFPVQFYAPYRRHVEKVHGRSFFSYMTSGQNAFPQDRMDFTAMGAFAWAQMRDLFHWIDMEKGPYPKDRLKNFWSHGGITREIREEIEKMLE